MSTNYEYLEYIGVFRRDTSNKVEELAKLRLFYMGKEAYWAEKRRAVEKELVLNSIGHPPKSEKKSLT
tara:strand:+ start:290 stop:493 length:204 start_codon:yes stop_codon:yes gene_type:complete